MKYVVTGCARSGTKYTATVLKSAGLDCEHESVFNRWTPEGGLHEGWQEIERSGDSSFIAAPHVGELSESLTVVHIVRPPLDVISSITGMGFLGDERQPYVQYIFKHCPEVANQAPGVNRAARYWLDWNRLADAHSDLRWDVSHIRQADVRRLATATEISFKATTVKAAIRDTSRSTNSLGDRPQVQMIGLAPELADEVKAEAERYKVSVRL